MKLFKEFKLYETMWDAAQATNNQEIDIQSSTEKTYYKTFGRKKYNLYSDEELRRYIDLLTSFQQKREKANGWLVDYYKK